MTTQPKCRSCGGESFECGAVQSTGAIYFRPRDVPFLTLATADVPITATMCRDCGSIGLIGDQRKLERLTGDRSASREAATL